MKRIILTYFVLIAISVNSVVGQAMPISQDSYSIDAELREKIPAEPTDTVVRVYLGWYFWGFSERLPLDEITKKPYTYDDYFWIFSEKESKAVGFLQDDAGEYIGDAVEFEPTYNNLTALQNVLEKQDDILSVLGEGITVTQTHFFDGLYVYEGIFVYFVTNIGDYVYYCDCNRYGAYAEGYLLPLDQFYDFAKAVYDYQTENGHLTGGAPNYGEIYDLSPYSVTHYTFDQANPPKGANHSGQSWKWVIIVCAPLCIFGFGYLIYKKKKRSSQ